MMQTNHHSILQVFKYLGVGGSTAVVYFSLIFVTVHVLQLGHYVAVTISYVCAISFHFFANKFFTFESRDAKVAVEMLRYLLVALTNYLITLAVVFVVVDWARQSTYLGALLAIVVTLGLGYGMTKFWVFQHKREPL